MNKQFLIYRFFFTGLILLSAASVTWSHPAADPVLSMLSVNRLEQRIDKDDTETQWDVDAWLGKDLHKLWIKTEGSYSDGNRESSELELLYSRGVSPYWDIQTGWRGDFNNTDNRQWFALGLQGLAPYFFETEITLYLGQHGQTAVRLDTDYELLLTQKWVLRSAFEADIYGRNDRATKTGSGLSEIEAGLYLRYEIRREFAPYIGLSYERQFGDTAHYTRSSGQRKESLEYLMGIKFWF